MLTPEQLADYRAKAAAGTLSFDEQRAIIAAMREGRQTAAATTKAKKAAAGKTIDADSLLKDLLS